MALGIRRKRTASLDMNLLIPIVADAAIGTGAIGDGRLIPLIIFDGIVRPDLAELVRVHQTSDLGDVDCQWGKVDDGTDSIALVLKFKRPVELTGFLKFDLAKYDGFVDQIITAKTLYLQAGKPGDRLKYNVDAPKIYVEVPDTGFGGENWDDIFYRNAVKRMRAAGLSRQRAKTAAKQYVTEWRKFGRVRVGRLY
jgi:hypothetical protein